MHKNTLFLWKKSKKTPSAKSSTPSSLASGSWEGGGTEARLCEQRRALPAKALRKKFAFLFPLTPYSKNNLFRLC